MSKRSCKPYESHGKSRNGRITTVSGGCVVYCLNVTSRIKDYAFQINRLLHTEVKGGKFKPRRRRMQIFWLYSAKWSISTKTNEVAGQALKAICSQLETLENRAIIYNFIL